MIEVQCQPMSVSEVGIWGTISVQFSCSVVSDSVTPWTTARWASLSITNSQGLFKLMSIESVMPSKHLFFGRPLPLLPSIFPSIRVFSNELALCIRYCSIRYCSIRYWSIRYWSIRYLELFASKVLELQLQHQAFQ